MDKNIFREKFSREAGTAEDDVSSCKVIEGVIPFNKDKESTVRKPSCEVKVIDGKDQPARMKILPEHNSNIYLEFLMGLPSIVKKPSQSSDISSVAFSSTGVFNTTIWTSIKDLSDAGLNDQESISNWYNGLSSVFHSCYIQTWWQRDSWAEIATKKVLNGKSEELLSLIKTSKSRGLDWKGFKLVL
ncbi:MAG TPA: hypothetical protein PKV80_29335, partial [Leptospiraceae bacterium]|nr:hypothetical protein [Leptospiraceae bacterium]